MYGQYYKKNILQYLQLCCMLWGAMSMWWPRSLQICALPEDLSQHHEVSTGINMLVPTITEPDRIRRLGCKYIHTFLGTDLTEHNVIYF